jgi:cytochrome b pre-mRNA-processing protein 3
MGISDQGVPRQMKRVGEAFYGRAKAYEAALAQADNGLLAEALARNVYAETTEPQVAAMRLAAYVRQVADALQAQELGALARGAVRFPEPERESLKIAAELNS